MLFSPTSMGLSFTLAATGLVQAPRPFPLPDPSTVEIQIIPVGDDDPLAKLLPKMLSTIPLNDFSSMFPVSGVFGQNPQIDSYDTDSSDELTVQELDAIMNSILKELGDTFHSDVKPMMQHMENKPSEHPCAPDVERLCKPKPGMKQLHESRIHCLGRNADQLSDVCRKSVERSVPFICAEEIELYCNSESTLEQGVLQCLEEAFDKEKKPMSVSCQDSMKATRSIVDSLKSQKVQLVESNSKKPLNVKDMINMKKKGWKGTWFYYLVGTLILACICVVLAFVYKYQGMPNRKLFKRSWLPDLPANIPFFSRVKESTLFENDDRPTFVTLKPEYYAAELQSGLEFRKGSSNDIEGTYGTL